MRATAYRSELTDPYQNLALETSIYEALGREDRALFLYRNEPSIVIGRHQNPWRECDLAAMRRDGVMLVRRQSGGGTVYHDLGNLNYTFFAPREAYDQEGQFGVVIDALAHFGIAAERSGRNDLLVEGRKISGSAFKHKRERSFHHGTVLIDSDLDRLNRYLEAPERRLESKGIVSVRSVVVNAQQLSRDVGFDALCDAIESEWARYVGVEIERAVLGEAALRKDSRAQQDAAELLGWEWLFGKTPDFTETHVLPESECAGIAASVTVTLSVHRGYIREVELENDRDSSPDDGVSLSPLLSNELAGLRYDGAELERAAERMRGGAAEITQALARRV